MGAPKSVNAFPPSQRLFSVQDAKGAPRSLEAIFMWERLLDKPTVDALVEPLVSV